MNKASKTRLAIMWEFYYLTQQNECICTHTYITGLIQGVVGAIDELVHEFSEFVEDVIDHATKYLTFATTKCHLLKLEILQSCLEVVLKRQNNQ